MRRDNNKGYPDANTIRRVLPDSYYLTRAQARSESYQLVDVISSRHATGHSWVRARSEIVNLSTRGSSEDGKNRQRISLALRPEATTGCEGSDGCDIVYIIGVRDLLVRAWDKYMVSYEIYKNVYSCKTRSV